MKNVCDVFKKDVNSVLRTISHSSYRDLSVYCRLQRLVLTFRVHQNVLLPVFLNPLICLHDRDPF